MHMAVFSPLLCLTNTAWLCFPVPSPGFPELTQSPGEHGHENNLILTFFVP